MWNPHQVLAVMTPIVKVLRLADSDSPSASKIQYHMFETQEVLKKVNLSFLGPDEDDMKQELVAIHRARWDYGFTAVQGAGYILDPEYWDMEHDDGGEMMEALFTMIDKTYYMPKDLTGTHACTLSVCGLTYVAAQRCSSCAVPCGAAAGLLSGAAQRCSSALQLSTDCSCSSASAITGCSAVLLLGCSAGLLSVASQRCSLALHLQLSFCRAAQRGCSATLQRTPWHSLLIMCWFASSLFQMSRRTTLPW
jgi:hypothetical protein